MASAWLGPIRGLPPVLGGFFDAASTTRAAAGSDGRDLPTSGGRLIGARYGSGAVFSIEDMRREIEQKTMKYPMRSIENDIEFKSAWDENELQLCLVGFTGTGKSLRASQLKEQHGFEMAGVAELLAEDLEFGGKVEVPPGVDPLDAVEDWLGYPTDKGFKEREKTYLAEIDKQVRLNAVPELGGNFVLDTVASVAFLPQETLEVLRERYFIIHFEPSDQELKDMVEWYTAPGGKYPVVWGDFWLQRQSSEEEALRRCYPEMLRWRRQKYKELAHVNVPASLAADTDVPLQEVIDAVTNQLNAMEFLESSGLF
eukprot:tig00000403_g336.t1